MCFCVAAGSLITLLAACSCAHATDEVALIIDKSVYEACESNILRYKADVEAQFPVHLKICHEANFESWEPYQIRSYIQNEYNTNHINGVVLAGQIKYDTWKQSSGNQGINSLYYEDLDGSFTDTEDDYYDDYHTWGSHTGPEVWCSWMRPPSNDSIGGLNAFLDKTHDYYTGGVSFNHSALIADSSDYDNNIRGAYGYQYQSLSKLYGNNIDVLGEGSEPLRAWDYGEMLEKNSYEICDTFTHANAWYQCGDNGDISSWYIKGMQQGGSIMTLIFGCHSADFAEAPSDNIAQAYVFGSGIGQVSIGTSWSFGITEKYAIYDVLANGGYFGQGWFNLQKLVNDPAYIKQCYNNQVDVNRYLWGQNMIGNPFVYANYTPPVPEPSSILGLLIPGMGAFCFYRRKKS